MRKDRFYNQWVDSRLNARDAGKFYTLLKSPEITSISRWYKISRQDGKLDSTMSSLP